MNIVPEIRTALSNMGYSIMDERINQLMGLCEDALRRHIGNLDRAIEQEKKDCESDYLYERRNPLDSRIAS